MYAYPFIRKPDQPIHFINALPLRPRHIYHQFRREKSHDDPSNLSDDTILPKSNHPTFFFVILAHRQVEMQCCPDTQAHCDNTVQWNIPGASDIGL